MWFFLQQGDMLGPVLMLKKVFCPLLVSSGQVQSTVLQPKTLFANSMASIQKVKPGNINSFCSFHKMHYLVFLQPALNFS